MSRADRLLDLPDRLRAAAETTVAGMARELGVSARTLHRDLATLRRRGVSISGQSGPGGGIRLDAGRGVSAVPLSSAEIVSLWLAARLAQETAEVPWSRRADSALAKLLASLPRDRARELRDLCRRIYFGPPASSQVRSGASSPPPELLRLFEEAVWLGVVLRFEYRDREGRVTRRHVEPHGLLVQSPVWYIMARDIEKNLPRSFRMDRIARAELVRARRFTPDDRVIDALLAPGVAWQPLLPRFTRGRS